MKMVLPISYYGMINTKKPSTYSKIYQQKNNDKGILKIDVPVNIIAAACIKP